MANRKWSGHLDGVRVEYKADERALLDVFAFVGDVDLPLANLVRLEGGRVDAVVVHVHRAGQDAAGRRPGVHFQ